MGRSRRSSLKPYNWSSGALPCHRGCTGPNGRHRYDPTSPTTCVSGCNVTVGVGRDEPPVFPRLSLRDRSLGGPGTLTMNFNPTTRRPPKKKTNSFFPTTVA